MDLAATYPFIITLGKTATTSMTGNSQSILAMRGGPIELDGIRIMPTMHPAFVLRAPGWRYVLQSDIGKAFRLFEGRLRWTEPDRLMRPTPEQLESWLAVGAPFFSYDVETDGIEPLACKMRTIAIATPDVDAMGRAVGNGPAAQVSRAIGIGILSVDGVTRFYSPDDESRIKEILRRVFVDGRIWVGHNAGSYDRQVVERYLGVTPAPLVDTLFAARFKSPDLPKGLKTVGSILTDVERWETTEKGQKISTGSEDDDELLLYNTTDTVVNARIVVPLVEAAEKMGAFDVLPVRVRPLSWSDDQPFNLHEIDHATQDMCVGLHKAGIWIDQVRRRELETEYELSVAAREKRLGDISRSVGIRALDIKAAGHDDDQDSLSPVNPGSYDQIRNLLYTRWKLPIPAQLEARDFYTETGLPGTGDAVLRAHLASGGLSSEQEAFIRELRLYRREKNKVLGTILRPLRLRLLDPKIGVVWDDGRVRSTWNAHVTSVGRLSSSRPNVQNIASRRGLGRLKAVFAAPPGRIFVGADLDQAHLRIVANYWKIPRLLEAFTDGADPHNLLAVDVFGSDFRNADGWGPDGFSVGRKPRGGRAKAMRDVMKTFRYASIYAADPSTVWQVLTATETDKAELPYLRMTLREVQHIHKQWLKSEPEWQDAWARMQKIYEREGSMTEPVFRRRSGPLSDGKKQEVVNFPILAAESSLMRMAEHAVMSAFPFDYAGKNTGMVHQCHDSIAVEVPLPPGFDPLWQPEPGVSLPPEIECLRRTVEDCMTLSLSGWPVPFTSEADVGRNLKEI